MEIFEKMLFGSRIYAQGRWWIRIQMAGKGWFLVCDRDAVSPAPVLLIYQTEDDKKYPEILFRKFK